MSFIQEQAIPDPTEEELFHFEQQATLHENHITDTWEEQSHIEHRIFDIRRSHPPNTSPVFLRDKHIQWLQRSLRFFPRGLDGLDALQGWAAYWIIHSLNLLSSPIPPDIATRLVRHFSQCRDRKLGGYGGGVAQSAHLASTYSVLMALCALGTREALESVDADEVGRFVEAMKLDNGAFRVSEGGEVDVRACYCALSVASMVGLLEGERGDGLRKGCAEWLRSLQGFDGGMGGEAGGESHGGNTYCGLAAMMILGEEGLVDRESILDWVVMRQMGYEGGFQGRTHKLVDSCYSFWVGGIFAMLGVMCFDAEALVRYVLECCQLENGGLRDKPGTGRDFMHTCYALSGLSIAQHWAGATVPNGGVKKINVLYNLGEEQFEKAWRFFREK